MTDTPTIPIDRAQRFEHLARAPIVEAVIEFRARVEAKWVEEDISRRLGESLTEYPNRQSLTQGSFTAHIQLGPRDSTDQESESAPTFMRQGWLGVRATESDGLQIAQFKADGFSFSRLAPYESWDQFRTEALRLWEIHRSLSESTEIARIGVRFINRLEVPIDGLEFGDYFRGFPDNPGDLPTAEFLYQDSMGVPGHPYIVKLARTFQLPQADNATTLSLLLDIDAFCPEPCPVEVCRMEERLADLHWLNNRVFFDTLTKKALELCR